jgi:DNA-binding response OmpR family regulator
MAQSILIVDDEEAMLDFLKQRLAPEGFAISMATTGDEGIKQAIAHQPDVILLDLRMPIPDGVAVCKALRANDKTKLTPILVITGVLSPAQIEESMASGADDFVSKPINIPDLLIRIRAILECRAITDPVERLTRYTELVREMTSKAPRRPAPAG